MELKINRSSIKLNKNWGETVSYIPKSTKIKFNLKDKNSLTDEEIEFLSQWKKDDKYEVYPLFSNHQKINELLLKCITNGDLVILSTATEMERIEHAPTPKFSYDYLSVICPNCGDIITELSNENVDCEDMEDGCMTCLNCNIIHRVHTEVLSDKELEEVFQKHTTIMQMEEI